MDGQVQQHDQWLGVPGGEVFVRIWQPLEERGVPLLLLHDSLGSVAQWRDWPAQLTRACGRRVIAYDRLGFGASSVQQRPLGLDFIADEARIVVPAVLDGLGVGEFAVLGHSVGGAMALSLAASLAPRCVAVVSISAQAFIEPRTLAGIEQARLAFADPGQRARLGRWHGERSEWVLSAWIDTWTAPGFAGWSLAALLPQVRCPALVIHGQEDEYGSVAFPQAIAAGVSGPVQLLILPGCGHVPQREQPQPTTTAVVDFLAAQA